MENRYEVQITKYALTQMEEIRDYITNELYGKRNQLMELGKMELE